VLKLSSTSPTQALGESSRALGGAALIPLWRKRQPQHDALGVELVHGGRDGVQVVPAALARDRGVRQGRDSQGVRHGDADALRTQVDGDDSAQDELVYTSPMSDHPKPPGADAGTPQIQIDLDEVTAQGAYSNLVLINHNDNEFVLDFAYIQPGAPRARVRSRVISSPRHTKRLLRALEYNIRRFEERFGKIEEPDPLPTGAPGGLIS
jgi:hypothetical protein